MKYLKLFENFDEVDPSWFDDTGRGTLGEYTIIGFPQRKEGVDGISIGVFDLSNYGVEKTKQNLLRLYWSIYASLSSVDHYGKGKIEWHYDINPASFEVEDNKYIDDVLSGRFDAMDSYEELVKIMYENSNKKALELFNHMLDIKYGSSWVVKKTGLRKYNPFSKNIYANLFINSDGNVIIISCNKKFVSKKSTKTRFELAEKFLLTRALMEVDFVEKDGDGYLPSWWDRQIGRAHV